MASAQFEINFFIKIIIGSHWVTVKAEIKIDFGLSQLAVIPWTLTR
jgi:hypothetical protein